MLLCIADVLSESDLQSAQAALAAAEFRDGRATAGWSAARVKKNLQAVSGQAGVDELRRTLEARILGHALQADVDAGLVGPLPAEKTCSSRADLRRHDTLMAVELVTCNQGPAVGDWS